MRTATFVVSLICGVASAQAQTTSNQDFVIRGAHIFDGTRVIASGDVWVQNGMIKAVGPHLRTPATLRVVDGTGKTLLPGLIDTHVHTMGEPDFLRSALALGVTTELDMGSAPQFADRIEHEQAAGKDLDMADLRSSRWQPTAPNGHGTEYNIPIPTISTPAAARAEIDTLVAAGADFIGEIIYDDGSEYGLRIPTLNKETLKAVIDAAHARGKLAVVHVLSLRAAKVAIDAGADGLVHLFADSAPDEAFFSLAAQHHVFVIPTLSLLTSMGGKSSGPRLAEDPRIAPYLSTTAIADLHTSLPRPVGNADFADSAVRRLHALGIPILAGTDAHNPGTAHGASLLDELQLLVNAGLTPAEALASATSVNATAFRLTDRGQITPGKRADLVLVNGDPTVRVADVLNIAAVWKLGVQDDREAYRVALDSAKAAEVARRNGPAPIGSEAGLVSDFEQGAPGTAFGLGWKPVAGRMLGGEKPDVQIAIVDSGANGSQKALQISGAIPPGVFGWSGAVFFPGPAPMVPVNLSGKKAISFWTRGDGGIYQLMLLVRSKGSLPVGRPFTAGSDWKQVTIAWSDFGTDGSDLQGLMIAAVARPGPFRLLIDDVRLEPSNVHSSR